MKQVRVTFTDEEHFDLIIAKGPMTWHDFILSKKELVKNVRS